MDTVLRRLFTKKSKRRISPSRSGLVQGQSYDSVVAARPPTKGSYPLGGNGPVPVIRPRPRPRSRLQPPRQDSRRPSIELVADAPSIPRRRHSDTNLFRPQTAQAQGSFTASHDELNGWPRLRYSAIVAPPPTLRRRSRRQKSTVDLSAARCVSNMAALTSEMHQPEERLPYVDLLEAFWHLKPSRETYVGRTQASGRRDYGEDVADRNIADYRDNGNNSDNSDNVVPVAEPSLDVRSWTDGRSQISRYPSDEISDDTILNTTTSTHSQLGQIGTISTYTPTHDDPHQRVVRTYANTAGGLELHQPKFTTHGLRLRPRPQSAFADSRPFGASSRPTSMMSTRTHLSSNGHDIIPLRSSEWMPPVSKSKLDSRERSALIAGLAAISTTKGASIGDLPLGSNPYNPTLPAAPPQLLGQGSPLTPPMSPTTKSSPTERSSLDAEIPALPAAPLIDQSPRDSADEAREPSRIRADSVAAAIIEHEGYGETEPPGLKKRSGRVFEESADGLETQRAIARTDGVDTEVITRRKPAVVHEHVIPKVHEIREEQITREIHHHDVLHRMQPVIDVEILPTKHYIPAPSGDGLIEIPASAVPGRHQNWDVKPVEENGRSSSETAASVHVPRSRGNSTRTFDAQPIVSNGTKTMTLEGFVREETTWRYPPELESGGQKRGQTVPLDIYHDDYDDDFDEYSDRRSSIGGQEEELLFNDSEAFGGRLPGLDDWNPAIPGDFSLEPAVPAPRRIDVPESEATRALKQRQAEVTRKMASMSVEE